MKTGRGITGTAPVKIHHTIYNTNVSFDLFFAWQNTTLKTTPKKRLTTTVVTYYLAQSKTSAGNVQENVQKNGTDNGTDNGTEN